MYVFFCFIQFPLILHSSHSSSLPYLTTSLRHMIPLSFSIVRYYLLHSFAGWLPVHVLSYTCFFLLCLLLNQHRSLNTYKCIYIQIDSFSCAGLRCYLDFFVLQFLSISYFPLVDELKFENVIIYKIIISYKSDCKNWNTFQLLTRKFQDLCFENCQKKNVCLKKKCLYFFFFCIFRSCYF